MTPGHGLFRSAAIYIAANAITSAIPLLLLPVMTRALSPADYGIVAMYSIFQTALFPLVGLSMKQAIISRYFHGGERDLPHFITTCLVVTLASMLAVALCLWPLRNVISDVTHVPASWLFLAIVGAGAQFAISVELSLLQVRRMPTQFGALLVTQGAMNFGLSVLFVVGLGLAWQGRILGQFLSLAIVAVIALTVLWRTAAVAWPPRQHDATDALSFSLPLVPQGIGGMIVLIADRALITNLLGVEQTGVYTAALQVSMGLGLLIDAFNRAYAPWLFAGLKENAPGFRARVVRGTYLYATGAAGLAIAIGLAAPLIVQILFGPAFRASAGFIPYLAAGFAFSGLYYLVANQLLFARRTGLLTTASVVAGIAHILLSVALITLNGAAGAAQAFMLSQGLLFLLTWWLARGALPMPWFDGFSRNPSLSS